MKNILPPLLQRCQWTKKNKEEKSPNRKKPQGCSIMQLPGRCWREGRAAPSDSSGGEDAQREHLNYSPGIKGIGTHSLQPPASVLCSPPPVCLAWHGTSFHPKITEMSFSMAPPYPSLVPRAD